VIECRLVPCRLTIVVPRRKSQTHAGGLATAHEDTHSARPQAAGACFVPIGAASPVRLTSEDAISQFRGCPASAGSSGSVAQVLFEELGNEGIDVGVFEATVAAVGDRVKRHFDAGFLQGVGQNLALVERFTPVPFLTCLAVSSPCWRGVGYFDFFLLPRVNCSRRARASLLPMSRRATIRATCSLRGRDVPPSQL
jgi:hypothetical protein